MTATAQAAPAAADDLQPRRGPPRLTWRALTGAFALVVFGCVAMGAAYAFLPIDPATLGTFGDFFGALNTLFSALALLTLVIALTLQSVQLHNQRQELALQRQDLALQRKEMALTREEVRRGAVAQEEMTTRMDIQSIASLISGEIQAHGALRIDLGGDHRPGKALLAAVSEQRQRLAVLAEDARRTRCLLESRLPDLFPSASPNGDE